MRQDFFCPVYRMSCSCLPLPTPRCEQREQPYPAFFEKEEGAGGRRKNFFLREKKFFLLPPVPSDLSQTTKKRGRG